MSIWDRLKAEYEAELAKKPSIPITVTLPDGKEIEAQSWKTTPYDVAKGIRYFLLFSVLKFHNNQFPFV